jgi:hypothetical protein
MLFQVSGIEGGSTADDTWQTAHQLGSVVGAGLVQVAGSIGDDPNYNPLYNQNSTDPGLSNPASDVDLYHIHVDGPGTYILTAEVFAGRIGSTLQPGISLFVQDPSTQALSLVAGSFWTFNNTPATDGTLPLMNDAFLYYGLTSGDYYLAVSSWDNTPDPDLGIPVGGGIFDPNISHSGTDGSTTGKYVLNLQVEPDPSAPYVVSTDLAPNTTLTALTRVNVTFSSSINLVKLAFLANLITNQGVLPSVFVQDVNSPTNTWSPRLESYDPVTNEATFLMLDNLPDGSYTFHLSGPDGIQDYGGLALIGNDPSGDYVIPFTIQGSPRGSLPNPTQVTTALHSDSDPPQDLGVLFPEELVSGVTITRDFTAPGSPVPADSGDTYQIELLQDRGDYVFNLNISGLPPGVQATVTLTPEGGTPFNVDLSGFMQLTAGTYILTVSGWDATSAPGVTYTLQISITGSPEPAAPLTIGAAPALRVRLVDTPPPSQPSTPPSTSPSVPGQGTPPASPAIGNSNRSSNPAGIPSGLLLSLALGPQGGVTDTEGAVSRLGSDVFAQVFGSSPGLFLNDGVHLTLLNKEGNLVSADLEGATLGGGTGAVGSWLGSTLDGLFRLFANPEDRSAPPAVLPELEDLSLEETPVGLSPQPEGSPWLEAEALPRLLGDYRPDELDVALAVLGEPEHSDPTVALALGAFFAGAGGWLAERRRKEWHLPFTPRITPHESSR